MGRENDLFNDGILPDNDYIGIDDDDEELGEDYHEMAGDNSAGPSESNQSYQGTEEKEEKESRTGLPAGRKGRKAKIKPMPASMRRKYPDTASILITKKDGTHILLVNR
jgi:hypothetical protein